MSIKMIGKKQKTLKMPASYLAASLAFLVPAAAPFAQEGGFGLEEPVKPPPDPEVLRNLTEVRSTVEVGAGYVSDDSFRFGKYTGLNEEGLFGVLNFDLYERGPYDADDATYWRVSGSNLGLSSRLFSAEQGEQGNYKVFFTYDQLPTFRSDSAQTIFDGVGSTNLTLPAGWVESGNTAGMTQLTSSLEDVDIESERKRLGAGFGKVLGGGWDFKALYRHETKEGLKTIGGVIGNSGGNPRSVILPEPIDYVTDQLDIVLGYADKKKQFQLSYYLSLFDDKNESLTWQNPYAAIVGWDPSAGFAAGGEGRLALPPDNQFHQISASGGYNFTDTLHFTADVALGRMTQDEPFLPYTVNPTLAASITQPLPRASLDGRIDTTLVNLRLAGRPSPDWRWNAAYRYDDRDNKTPRDEYVYIGGDSQLQDTSVTSSRRRFNEPYSFTEQKLGADVGYRLAMRSDLTAGVERSEIERTFSEREEATEDTLKLGWRHTFTDAVTGGLRLARAERDGSTYRGDEPFLSSYSPDYTATVPGGWENHPDLRKFHLADRTRDKVTLFSTFLPAEWVTLGFNANYLNDDYHASELGLTKSSITSYILDATFIVSERTTTYAFAAYENLKSDQDGQSFSGGAVKLTQAADPARAWFAKHQDRVDTIGLGLKRTLVVNRLDIGADYIYAKTEADVDVTAGSALTVAPLPTAVTRLNSLNIYGSYQWKKDTAIRVGYWVEKFKSTDWAVDNVEPNTLANVITLGEDSPDYTVHVITLSLRQRF